MQSGVREICKHIVNGFLSSQETEGTRKQITDRSVLQYESFGTATHPFAQLGSSYKYQKQFWTLISNLINFSKYFPHRNACIWTGRRT
jgi:hypothetical protein